MDFKRSCLLLISAAACISLSPLPEASSAISKDFTDGARLTGTNYSSLKIIHDGTAKTVEFTVKEIPDRPYFSQYIIPVKEAVREGDILLASFKLRSSGSSDETGEAVIELVFERGSEPYDAAASGKISAGKSWKTIYLPIISKTDFKPGESHIGIRLGLLKQTLQISDFTLVNYRHNVEVRNLPATAFDYQGRAPDAQWRRDALERIKKIRTSDIKISVTAGNRPVNGAVVSVVQTRNAFAFGTAINNQFISGNKSDSPDGKRYQEEIPLLFNEVVDEGELKWPEWESNRERAEKMVEWSFSKNLTMRGHNLVWERFDRMPSDIQSLTPDKPALEKRIREHIFQEVFFFKGKLVDWDVVNEPIPNTKLRDILGSDVYAGWHHEARKADPSVKLFVNEFNIEGTDDKKMTQFTALLEWMKQKNIPLDGIGSQCHIGMNPPPMQKVLESFDSLGMYTDDIKITEYDFNTVDEKLQADFTRDILIAAYSHPKVQGFLMWGFWDGKHWKKNAPIYRTDWSLKPSGQIWKDLVLSAWKTSVKGTTGKTGIFTATGHHGEYEITVKYKTRMVKKKITLGKDSLSIIIEI